MVKKISAVLLAVAAATVWFFFAQIYFHWYVRPFDRLIPVVMPWHGFKEIPADASLFERLSNMQLVLEATQRLSNYALLGMILSSAALVLYLTVVYQQKQQRVRENRLLKIKNMEIARRTEFIRYIAATIGHEFKNNLGRIKRRIDLLPGLSSEVRGRLDVNLSHLFADIDIFKKISDEREASLIAFTQVDLHELVAGIARQYEDLTIVTFRKCAPTPKIYAARDLLTTVIENIMDNAIKYRKPEQDRARITISCDRDADGSRGYVMISFLDEGIGMDEVQAGRCFYKGKESAGGWGEGLYFAKYVVGLHAGKIRVGRENTAPGKGTEIILNLPHVEETLNV